MIAADLLQSLVNKEHSDGLLIHPLGPTIGGDYPIVQYVEDTLIVMLADVD